MYVLAISKDIELWPKNLQDGSSCTQKASFYGNWDCEKNNLRHHSIHTLWLHVDDGHKQCYQLYFDCQKLEVDCKNTNYVLMYMYSTKCVAKVGNTGISPIAIYEQKFSASDSPEVAPKGQTSFRNDAARRLDWPTKLLANSELKKRHLAVELFNAIYVAKWGSRS